ncbi:hypothetical protein C2S51_000700 [Perilla frutescens var. frutescens]|nr:hypothetical protein C2S51_000700 [Perilla frutescens var. frutescens]
MDLMDSSLEGLAIFVGVNQTFAVGAADHYPELKPNSIYFTDSPHFDTTLYGLKRYGVHDVGVFDYETGEIRPCYYPDSMGTACLLSDHLVSANSSVINRGTLQSNSSLSLQFPPSFFTSVATPAGNHRQFFPGFDARLQLYYGDAHGSDNRHPGPKRKDKP